MEVVVGEGRAEAFGGEVEVGRECARCSEGRWCRRRVQTRNRGKDNREPQAQKEKPESKTEKD
jgi:hypothetical protein